MSDDQPANGPPEIPDPIPPPEDDKETAGSVTPEAPENAIADASGVRFYATPELGAGSWAVDGVLQEQGFSEVTATLAIQGGAKIIVVSYGSATKLLADLLGRHPKDAPKTALRQIERAVSGPGPE